MSCVILAHLTMCNYGWVRGRAYDQTVILEFKEVALLDPEHLWREEGTVAFTCLSPLLPYSHILGEGGVCVCVCLRERERCHIDVEYEREVWKLKVNLALAVPPCSESERALWQNKAVFWATQINELLHTSHLKPLLPGRNTCCTVLTHSTLPVFLFLHHFLYQSYCASLWSSSQVMNKHRPV